MKKIMKEKGKLRSKEGAEENHGEDPRDMISLPEKFMNF